MRNYEVIDKEMRRINNVCVGRTNYMHLFTLGQILSSKSFIHGSQRFLAWIPSVLCSDIDTNEN